jgi:ABC-type long-subunit fatty acid transport system fused permease/ATPase subunit
VKEDDWRSNGSFWITSAIWFYLIYQNWTPPLDCEVASLTWWIIYTFVGAAIILTLTVWKWEIKFAAKAWYEERDDYHEQRPKRLRG